MFEKRPDKHTTGLINMRNDCFANSSVQAYSALPGLTDYLNQMMEAYINVLQLVEDLGLDLDDVVLPESIAKLSRSKALKQNKSPKKASELFKLTLHVALAKIVKKLQETQMTSRTISVWTFLHEIERIYEAKMSRSQHDAHELTQLINETLEAENILCGRILKHIKENFVKDGATSEGLVVAEFPEFPFGGLVLSQMKCLTCSFVSKPNITPFLMLTLHPPQEISTDLSTLLDENESETITEYHCLRCRLNKIFENERCWKDQGKLNSEEEEALINQLTSYYEDDRLFINEDLSPELEKYVSEYNKLGLDILTVNSTVYRQTHILKPPKVFGIHLSRSAFDGVTVTRNPCRVNFSDKLSLSIDEKFLEDLQKFQINTDDENYAEDPKTRILTTDVNDMEDENVQQEDVELKGDEGEETDHLESSDGDTQGLGISDSESDSVSVSLASVASVTQSITTEGKAETFNRAPITEDQQKNLIKHFSKFEFSENNVYKYRLKSIIRHQGSHTQGHYECYKRKPLFVKDVEGKIIKLSPEIDEELVTQIENFIAELTDGTKEDRSQSESSTDLQETEDSEKGTFRRKFSAMMGRRPSVLQADPTEANLQEIIHSGLATPAEVMVDEVDYFLGPKALDIQKLMEKFCKVPKNTPRVKLKKIPSLIKSPYWRIGDSHVTEVTRSAVLFETASVYMLYFERNDGGLVKR